MRRHVEGRERQKREGVELGPTKPSTCSPPVPEGWNRRALPGIGAPPPHSPKSGIAWQPLAFSQVLDRNRYAGDGLGWPRRTLPRIPAIPFNLSISFKKRTLWMTFRKQLAELHEVGCGTLSLLHPSPSQPSGSLGEGVDGRLVPAEGAPVHLQARAMTGAPRSVGPTDSRGKEIRC